MNFKTCLSIEKINDGEIGFFIMRLGRIGNDTAYNAMSWINYLRTIITLYWRSVKRNFRPGLSTPTISYWEN